MKINVLIKKAEQYQKDTLMLIPSENYASKKVRAAVGSMLSNKYSEGYPGKRYYSGNTYIDKIETLAQKKAKKLFQVEAVNVQAYSGSIANAAVYFGVLDPGDKIMGLKLKAGGHLTHGHPGITFSGIFYEPIQFDLGPDDHLDYQKIKKLAQKEKPRLILIGTTAYPFIVDWQALGKIADSINAFLVADISHIAGLIIGGVYPSPAKYAHLITTTTHKTLRGPRGAMIMTTKKGLDKDPDLAKKIDKAVFPGLQGGPHNHTIAGIAQCLTEAETKKFKTYSKQIISNSKALASALQKNNLKLVGGGTDSHLMLIDLTPQNLTGNIVAFALEQAGIIVNKNTIPNDPGSAFYPSGIRLGTPAVTTRGMGEQQMKLISNMISRVIDEIKNYTLPEDKEEKQKSIKKYFNQISKNKELKNVRKEVKSLTKKFPLN